MNLLEIMERAGTRETARARAYIHDAIVEIAETFPEKTEQSLIDVVAGQRLYNLPGNLVRLYGIYRKYDDEGKYVRIRNIRNIDMLEKGSASTSEDGSGNLVVL